MLATEKPPMLTPEQVAIRCQVHYRTVMNWIKSGELRAIRLVRGWRIEQSDLEAFLQRYSNEEGYVPEPRRTQAS